MRLLRLLSVLCLIILPLCISLTTHPETACCMLAVSLHIELQMSKRLPLDLVSFTGRVPPCFFPFLRLAQYACFCLPIG